MNKVLEKTVLNIFKLLFWTFNELVKNEKNIKK